MKENQTLKNEALSSYFELIIKGVGEDSTREGLEKTPLRAAKALEFFTQGYSQDAIEVLIAYIPNGKIVGLSKLPRVVDIFARRLQVQERLTHEIINCIQNTLNPYGVAVVIEARHMCMMMRGVQKQNSMTTTSAFTGVFKTFETRNEFLNLIK